MTAGTDVCEYTPQCLSRLNVCVSVETRGRGLEVHFLCDVSRDGFAVHEDVECLSEEIRL